MAQYDHERLNAPNFVQIPGKKLVWGPEDANGYRWLSIVDVEA